MRDEGSRSILNRSEARLIVVDPVGSVRQTFVDVLRGLGFVHIKTVASSKDALVILESEATDWLLMTMTANDEITALHVLKLVTQYPSLRRTRCSLFVDGDDEVYLPLAYELGLLSHHEKSLAREILKGQIDDLLVLLNHHKGNDILVAAEYLKGYLVRKRFFQSFLGLQENLATIYPGVIKPLLDLAEAQFLNKKKEDGITTLAQIEVIDDKASPLCERLRKQYLSAQDLAEVDSHSRRNSLGIKTAVLIDSDTSVDFGMKEHLTRVGVKAVEAFDSGLAAWEWLKTNPEPQLILMEWRIPGLTGPALVQRIRQHGFISVPIIIVSSLTNSQDLQLLQEMGVDDVLEKPFDRGAFFKKIAGVLQNSRFPREQRSFELKIRKLLALQDLVEAQRLIAEYVADERIDTASKQGVLAEFEFARGNFSASSRLAANSLMVLGEKLPQLDVLGKSLLKMKKFKSALKCFDRAQKVSPKNIERLLQIATIQLDQGQAGEAQNTIECAKAVDPTNPNVLEVDCACVLEQGNTSAARKLFSELESSTKILRFMNNRAVTMIRTGAFEEGIELYRTTLRALPPGWAEIAVLVNYNLALALARYGALVDALKELEGMAAAPPGNNIGRKITSLRSKVKSALENGTPLILGCSAETEEEEFDRDTPLPMPPQADQSWMPKTRARTILPAEFEMKDLLGCLEVSRGDLCCYLIFEHHDEVRNEGRPDLSKLPPFNPRPSDPKESHPKKTG